MQKLAPIDIDRIEKAINGVLADLAARGICLKIAEEVLSGERQAKDHPHNHNGSNAALLDHVALLQ